MEQASWQEQGDAGMVRGSSANHFVDMFFCPISMQVMQDPVTTVDGFTYERELIESWLLAHDTSPSSGAPLSSKRLTPNVALKAAIQEWSQISRAKTEIEDRRRQVLEQQQFVLQREQALYQVMQEQRTLQIAQARQEHEVCTLQGLRRPMPGSGLDGGEAPVEVMMHREVMQAAEGQRRAEEERAKERRRMEELEFEKQEKALQAQLKALEEEQRQRVAEEKAAEEQRRREREAQKVAAATEKKMRAEEKRLKKEEKERLRLQRKREQEEEAKKNQASNKEMGKSAKDRFNVDSNDMISPAASVRAESQRQLQMRGGGVVRGVGSLSSSIMHGFSFVVTCILSLGSGGGKMMSSLGYVFLAYLVYMCYEIIDILTGVHPLWEYTTKDGRNRMRRRREVEHQRTFQDENANPAVGFPRAAGSSDRISHANKDPAAASAALSKSRTRRPTTGQQDLDARLNQFVNHAAQAFGVPVEVMDEVLHDCG